MSISTQDIINRVRQALDAEENPTNPVLGYYDDAKDIIPNINNAVRWFINTVNSFLEEKKFSSEIFREISYTRIFQTSSLSRIGFDASAMGHEAWTVLAVYPDPIVYPTAAIPTHLPHYYDSLYETAVTFVSSTQSAKRLTLGEWNKNAKNPLEDGNIMFTKANAPSLVSYAYLPYSNYGSSVYLPTIEQEIEIRPVLANAFCGVVYVAVPATLTAGTDPIPFPITATNIIYEKTLSLLATKIGDQTTIATKTDEELGQLLKAIS